MKKESCDRCKGRGYVLIKTWQPLLRVNTLDCPVCDGTGKKGAK